MAPMINSVRFSFYTFLALPALAFVVGIGFTIWAIAYEIINTSSLYSFRVTQLDLLHCVSQVV